MLALTLARPAPPDTRSRRDRDWDRAGDGDGDTAIGAAVLKFLFWTATFKPLLMGVALVGMVAYWLVNNTWQGRRRYHLRAGWAALASLYVTPWTPWAWIALAVGFDAWHAWREPTRWISAREQRVLARGCALAAAWSVLILTVDLPWMWIHVDAGMFTCDLPWSWGVPIWAPLAAAAVWPWSKHRRPRPVEEAPGPHPYEIDWAELVAAAPNAGPLAGSVLTHDPENGRFRLRVPPTSPDGADNADSDACRLLHRPRGTVTISIDPDGDANDYLVAFTEREDGSILRYWDGPTLTVAKNGLAEITVADAIDGRTITVPVAQPGGAAHGLVLAGSGHGKGILMRIIGLELCLWDRAWIAVADCKGEDQGGAGLPEFRAWADVYGWTNEQWRAVVEMYHELLSARAGRYGAAQRPFWHPDAPVDGYLDPLLELIIDELGKMIRVHGTKAFIGKLEDVSSQGRSFGCGATVDNQRGGRNDIVSPRFRNDIRKNGTTFIGQFGDRNSGHLAVQDLGVDLTKLPADPGWWYVKGGITQVPAVKARSRLLPSRDEATYLGFEAPHGTVEEWLARTRRATLHPQDAEIVAKWAKEFAQAPATTITADPGDVAALSVPAIEGEATEPAREVTEVAAGVHVEEPRRLHVVPPSQSARTARDLIPDVLRTAGRALTRSEIADRIGQSPTYVSELLKQMEGQSVKREKTPNGEPGWTVAA